MSKKHIFVFLLIAVACLALFSVGVWFAMNKMDPFNDRSFVSTEWKTNDDKIKAAMARDLVHHHLPVGMSETQVTTLLGQPDAILQGAADNGGNPLQGGRTYSYYLGSWSMHGYDDAFVYVHFDASEKVTGSEITGY